MRFAWSRRIRKRRGPVRIDLAGWAFLIALAAGPQVFGQGLIAWSLAHLPVAFASVSLLVQPVTAALVAWVLFNERIGPLQAVGGMIVLVGIMCLHGEGARGGDTPGSLEIPARSLRRSRCGSRSGSRLPRRCLFHPSGRTVVLSAGKAAASMAHAAETQWNGEPSGLAVTRYGHGIDCEHIEVIEAGHPLPDDVGRAAAGRFLALAHNLTQDDLLLFLMSAEHPRYLSSLPRVLR